MTDEELVARLRGVTIKQHAYGAYTLVPDPLSSSAADRVELLKEYYEAAEAFAEEKTTGNGTRLVRARKALKGN